jgi:DNA-binding NarL/FixJ family response regulator
VTITVVVVDDQPVVRAGVALMIGTQPDLEVAGEAPDGLAGPMRRLVEHFVRGWPRQSADLDRLTGREREVFVLMVRGLSNAAIARSLVIGETTAKTHVTRILTKLQLRDRAHAVIYGYETGLVRPGEGGAPGTWLVRDKGL